jgi:hypothetical protein
MSAPEPKRGDSAAAKSGDGTKFLLRQAPYLVALLLALAGVAYTNIARQPLTGYWSFWLWRWRSCASPRNGKTPRTKASAFG